MEFTPADRIRELSSISADVASMLEASGKAVDALGNRSITEGDGSIDGRKEYFQKNVTAFYTDLQGVLAKLRRQAYALEEAGIIASEVPSTQTIPQQRPNPATARTGAAAVPPREPDKITNGGLGSLDIGYLNSKGNKVGLEKEGELIDQAKKLLEDMVADSNGK